MVVDGDGRRAVRGPGGRPGDELALVDPANREALLGSPPRRLTWAQLKSESDFLAARLVELGLGRGDVLGVQLPNAIELVEVYIAAWNLGIVISPLPMQYREHEFVQMAAEAEFAAFLTCARFGERHPAAEALAVRDRVPSLEDVVVVGPDAECHDLPAGSTTGLPPRPRPRTRRSSGTGWPRTRTTPTTA